MRRPAIVRQPDGSFLAERARQLEDVVERSGRNSRSATPPRRSTRSAAIVMTQVGRVPVRGELVPGPGGFEIEVLDADPRRVKKVRIHAQQEPPPSGRETRRAPPRSGAATASFRRRLRTPVPPTRERREQP